MFDQSQYHAIETLEAVEELSKYCPGGYHPVNFDDKLKDGRYRIQCKLGFGSFSTVWLAEDTETKTNVSIKIIVAEQSHEHNRELKILQAITSNGDTSHPGHKYVSHLLDSFHTDGPNGSHLCIVTKFLGPTISTIADRQPNFRLESRLARRISLQLLQAVDYLRTCGVAHGDIHSGNVLFQLSTNEIEEPEGELWHEISKKDGSPNEKGVPDSIADSVCYGYGDNELSDEIQLIDFGEAFFISDPPKSIHTTMSFHLPELVFSRPLTEAIDIWNLGCTMCELITGRPPLEATKEDSELIPQFKEVLGGIPEQWMQEGLESGVLTAKPEVPPKTGLLALEEQIQSAYANNQVHSPEVLDLKENDLATLAEFIGMMCVVEPTKRAKLEDLKLHQWVKADGEVTKNNS